MTADTTNTYEYFQQAGAYRPLLLDRVGLHLHKEPVYDGVRILGLDRTELRECDVEGKVDLPLRPIDAAHAVRAGGLETSEVGVGPHRARSRKNEAVGELRANALHDGVVLDRGCLHVDRLARLRRGA